MARITFLDHAASAQVRGQYDWPDIGVVDHDEVEESPKLGSQAGIWGTNLSLVWGESRWVWACICKKQDVSGSPPSSDKEGKDLV